MLIEAIRDFEWLNEPDFCLVNDAFEITPSCKTDFWQDVNHNVSRDNGHFFFVRYLRDFILTAKWQINPEQPCGAQCGLMGRFDERNWCKISLVRNADQSWAVAATVCRQGISDLSLVPLALISDQMSYRLESYQGSFCLSYSLNGKDYIRVRLFQIPTSYAEIKAGAYICNPSEEQFSSMLLEVSH